ncbi:MAG: ABC transporter substrate-binding protein, partial [Clostridia bacterium]|nr:ABC transporter substrate-binding protein [Clostridia bacterium]
DDNLTTIKVNEVTDSVFYAPFYIAIEKGFFAEQGLKIDLSIGSGSDVSMTALLSKGADIILAGPETAVYVDRQDKKDKPKVFAQLTKRDGCFLISRNPEPDFSWQNLQNKEIIIGRQGGLPAMTFEYVVNNLGMQNGTHLTLRKDIQFALMGPTFDNGTGDYVTLFEPTASEFVASGKGHIVASVGEFSGEIPYTSFIALESFLSSKKDLATKFTKALYNAINYTKTADVNEVSTYLQKHFTTTPLTSLKASLQSYKTIDAWTSDLVLTESMFNKLIEVITNAGESVTGVNFLDIVDNTIANQVAVA